MIPEKNTCWQISLIHIISSHSSLTEDWFLQTKQKTVKWNGSREITLDIDDLTCKHITMFKVENTMLLHHLFIRNTTASVNIIQQGHHMNIGQLYRLRITAKCLFILFPGFRPVHCKYTTLRKNSIYLFDYSIKLYQLKNYI